MQIFAEGGSSLQYRRRETNLKISEWWGPPQEEYAPLGVTRTFGGRKARGGRCMGATRREKSLMINRRNMHHFGAFGHLTNKISCTLELLIQVYKVLFNT